MTQHSVHNNLSTKDSETLLVIASSIKLRGALTIDQTISAVGHNLTLHLHVRPPDLENSLKK